MPDPEEESTLHLLVGTLNKARKVNRELTVDDVRDMMRAGLTAANAFLDMEIRRRERERGGRP